jgi:hypothetical protein
MDRSEEVAAFCERIFTGRDLLQFMDEEGIGVGATMQIVADAERKHERHPDIYRQLDGIQPVVDWLRTLNDMYHWNDWLAIRLKGRFG